TGLEFPVGQPLTLTQMRTVLTTDRVIQIDFKCTRNSKHQLHFFFEVKNNQIMKIGQSPSLADLHLPDLRKYKKLLGDQKYGEFVRGVGLHAHGVGIGSFVYLRRILEDLVDQAEAAASKVVGWDHEQYARGRMDDKIQMLRGKLPDFLVENRSLYSIL